MKKLLLLSLLALSAMPVFAQQERASDVIIIEKQVDALVTSWNKHDHSQMANYTTEDVSWVNIVGMWWKGRQQVQFATQANHDMMFKNTSMTKKAVDVRFITEDVAVVQFLSHIGSFVTPDGQRIPENDELALLVFVKKAGKWLMTAGENVIVDPRAQKNDPILHMPK